MNKDPLYFKTKSGEVRRVETEEEILALRRELFPEIYGGHDIPQPAPKKKNEFKSAEDTIEINRFKQVPIRKLEMLKAEDKEVIGQLLLQPQEYNKYAYITEYINDNNNEIVEVVDVEEEVLVDEVVEVPIEESKTENQPAPEEEYIEEFSDYKEIKKKQPRRDSMVIHFVLSRYEVEQDLYVTYTSDDLNNGRESICEAAFKKLRKAMSFMQETRNGGITLLKADAVYGNASSNVRWKSLESKFKIIEGVVDKISNNNNQIEKAQAREKYYEAMGGIEKLLYKDGMEKPSDLYMYQKFDDTVVTLPDEIEVLTIVVEKKKVSKKKAEAVHNEIGVDVPVTAKVRLVRDDVARTTYIEFKANQIKNKTETIYEYIKKTLNELFTYFDQQPNKTYKVDEVQGVYVGLKTMVTFQELDEYREVTKAEIKSRPSLERLKLDSGYIKIISAIDGRSIIAPNNISNFTVLSKKSISLNGSTKEKEHADGTISFESTETKTVLNRPTENITVHFYLENSAPERDIYINFKIQDIENRAESISRFFLDKYNNMIKELHYPAAVSIQALEVKGMYMGLSSRVKWSMLYEVEKKAKYWRENAADWQDETEKKVCRDTINALIFNDGIIVPDTIERYPSIPNYAKTLPGFIKLNKTIKRPPIIVKPKKRKEIIKKKTVQVKKVPVDVQLSVDPDLLQEIERETKVVDPRLYPDKNIQRMKTTELITFIEKMFHPTKPWNQYTDEEFDELIHRTNTEFIYLQYLDIVKIRCQIEDMKEHAKKYKPGITHNMTTKELDEYIKLVLHTDLNIETLTPHQVQLLIDAADDDDDIDMTDKIKIVARLHEIEDAVNNIEKVLERRRKLHALMYDTLQLDKSPTELTQEEILAYEKHLGVHRDWYKEDQLKEFKDEFERLYNQAKSVPGSAPSGTEEYPIPALKPREVKDRERMERIEGFVEKLCTELGYSMGPNMEGMTTTEIDDVLQVILTGRANHLLKTAADKRDAITYVKHSLDRIKKGIENKTNLRDELEKLGIHSDKMSSVELEEVREQLKEKLKNEDPYKKEMIFEDLNLLIEKRAFEEKREIALTDDALNRIVGMDLKKYKCDDLNGLFLGMYLIEKSTDLMTKEKRKKLKEMLKDKFRVGLERNLDTPQYIKDLYLNTDYGDIPYILDNSQLYTRNAAEICMALDIDRDELVRRVIADYDLVRGQLTDKLELNKTHLDTLYKILIGEKAKSVGRNYNETFPKGKDFYTLLPAQNKKELTTRCVEALIGYRIPVEYKLKKKRTSEVAKMCLFSRLFFADSPKIGELVAKDVFDYFNEKTKGRKDFMANIYEKITSIKKDNFATDKEVLDILYRDRRINRETFNSYKDIVLNNIIGKKLEKEEIKTAYTRDGMVDILADVKRLEDKLEHILSSKRTETAGHNELLKEIANIHVKIQKSKEIYFETDKIEELINAMFAGEKPNIYQYITSYCYLLPQKLKSEGYDKVIERHLTEKRKKVSGEVIKPIIKNTSFTVDEAMAIKDEFAQYIVRKSREFDNETGFVSSLELEGALNDLKLDKVEKDAIVNLASVAVCEVLESEYGFLHIPLIPDVDEDELAARINVINSAMNETVNQDQFNSYQQSEIAEYTSREKTVVRKMITPTLADEIQKIEIKKEKYKKSKEVKDFNRIIDALEKAQYLSEEQKKAYKDEVLKERKIFEFEAQAEQAQQYVVHENDTFNTYNYESFKPLIPAMYIKDYKQTFKNYTGARINLNNWKFDQLETLKDFFKDNTSIEQIKLPSLYLDVEDASRMFDGMKKLQEIPPDITFGPKSKILSEIFHDCPSLKQIKQVTVRPSKDATVLMNGAFAYSPNLTSASIEIKDCRSINMDHMFKNDKKLARLDLKFNGQNLGSARGMFDGCESLTEISFKNKDFRNIRDFREMFKNCTNLRTVDLRGNTIGPGGQLTDMFNNCPRLEKVYIDRGMIDANLEEIVKTKRDIQFVIAADLAKDMYKAHPTIITNFWEDGTEAKLNELTIDKSKGGIANNNVIKDRLLANIRGDIQEGQHAELSNVVVPNITWNKGNYVFDSAMLTNCEFPRYDRVDGIGMFKNARLTNVAFPSCIKIVGREHFDNALLDKVYFPNAKLVGRDSFNNTKILTYMVLPKSVSKDLFSGIQNCNFYDVGDLTIYYNGIRYPNIAALKPIIEEVKNKKYLYVPPTDTFKVYTLLHDRGFDWFGHDDPRRTVMIDPSNKHPKLGEYEKAEVTVQGSGFTDASSMFEGSPLNTITFDDNFSSSSVTTMENMFKDSQYLRSITLDKLDTSNVKNTSGMFKKCIRLDFTKINTFNFDKVENASEMFSGCSRMKYIPFTDTPMKNLVYAQGMFKDCSSLLTADVTKISSNIKFANAMFKGCVRLETLDISSISGNLANSEVVADCPQLKTVKLRFEAFDEVAKETAGNKKLIYYVENDKVEEAKRLHPECADRVRPWNKWARDLINKSGGDVFIYKERADLIDYPYDLMPRISLDKDCTRMDFQGWKAPTVDLTLADLSNVEDMTYIFNGSGDNPGLLTSINLSGKNAPKVKSMAVGFKKNEKLVSADFSNSNYPNCESVNELFSVCYNLENINFRNVNMPKLNRMACILYGAKVETIDFSTFRGGPIKSAAQAFKLCKNVKTIDLTGLSFTTDCDFYETFACCDKLEKVIVGPGGLSVLNAHIPNEAAIIVPKELYVEALRRAKAKGIKLTRIYVKDGNTVIPEEFLDGPVISNGYIFEDKNAFAFLKEKVNEDIMPKALIREERKKYKEMYESNLYELYTMFAEEIKKSSFKHINTKQTKLVKTDKLKELYQNIVNTIAEYKKIKEIVQNELSRQSFERAFEQDDKAIMKLEVLLNKIVDLRNYINSCFDENLGHKSNISYVKFPIIDEGPLVYTINGVLFENDETFRHLIVDRPAILGHHLVYNKSEYFNITQEALNEYSSIIAYFKNAEKKKIHSKNKNIITIKIIDSYFEEIRKLEKKKNIIMSFMNYLYQSEEQEIKKMENQILEIAKKIRDILKAIKNFICKSFKTGNLTIPTKTKTISLPEYEIKRFKEVPDGAKNYVLFANKELAFDLEVTTNESQPNEIINKAKSLFAGEIKIDSFEIKNKFIPKLSDYKNKVNMKKSLENQLKEEQSEESSLSLSQGKNIEEITTALKNINDEITRIERQARNACSNLSNSSNNDKIHWIVLLNGISYSGHGFLGDNRFIAYDTGVPATKPLEEAKKIIHHNSKSIEYIKYPINIINIPEASLDGFYYDSYDRCDFQAYYNDNEPQGHRDGDPDSLRREANGWRDSLYHLHDEGNKAYKYIKEHPYVEEQKANLIVFDNECYSIGNVKTKEEAKKQYFIQDDDFEVFGDYPVKISLTEIPDYSEYRERKQRYSNAQSEVELAGTPEALDEAMNAEYDSAKNDFEVIEEWGQEAYQRIFGAYSKRYRTDGEFKIKNASDLDQYDYNEMLPLVFDRTCKYITMPNYKGGYINLMKDELSNAVSLENFLIGAPIKELYFTNKYIHANTVHGMFKNCSELKNALFTAVRLTDCVDMGELFANCPNLKNIVFGNVRAEHNTKLNNMFSGAKNLEVALLSGFTTGTVDNAAGMFEGCSKLKIVDLSTVTMHSNARMDNMFEGCNKLRIVILGENSLPILKAKTPENCVFYVPANKLEEAKRYNSVSNRTILTGEPPINHHFFNEVQVRDVWGTKTKPMAAGPFAIQGKKEGQALIQFLTDEKLKNLFIFDAITASAFDASCFGIYPVSKYSKKGMTMEDVNDFIKRTKNLISQHEATKHIYKPGFISSIYKESNEFFEKFRIDPTEFDFEAYNDIRQWADLVYETD